VIIPIAKEGFQDNGEEVPLEQLMQEFPELGKCWKIPA